MGQDITFNNIRVGQFMFNTIAFDNLKRGFYMFSHRNNHSFNKMLNNMLDCELIMTTRVEKKSRTDFVDSLRIFNVVNHRGFTYNVQVDITGDKRHQKSWFSNYNSAFEYLIVTFNQIKHYSKTKLSRDAYEKINTFELVRDLYYRIRKIQYENIWKS